MRYDILTKIKAFFAGDPPKMQPRPASSVIATEHYTPEGFAYFSNYDGEKTPYTLGTPTEVGADYYGMALRSWEAFYTVDIVQNAVNKYLLWVVGAGLKLQANPLTSLIQNQDFSEKEFQRTAETAFRLFCKQKSASHSRELNLHQLANEAAKNGMLAGDCLVVCRYSKSRGVTVQVVDARSVVSPILGEHAERAAKRGNTLRDGVETTSAGEHVAYYLRKNYTEFTRIPAYGAKTNRRQAWLMRSRQATTSDTRGLSLFSAVLQTVEQMDAYKDATLGTAEENANIAYTVEHNQFSDGSNPMIDQLKQSYAIGSGQAPETAGELDGESVASKIAKTTRKNAYNLPVGASLKEHGAKVDVNFKDFFETNAGVVYSTIGIPPEVAADKFTGAYSGSRAALKSWEHKINVDRENILASEFYQKVFEFWLDFAILDGEVQAPGYLDAKDDATQRAAYTNARFIGVGVPHIDPLKEINAIRRQLGARYDGVPLTTLEQSVERLNNGDLADILRKLEEEDVQTTKYTDDELGTS